MAETSETILARTTFMRSGNIVEKIMGKLLLK